MSTWKLALVGLVVLLPAATIAAGCSSSTDPENSGGTASTGGSPSTAGGSPSSISGTGPSATAGTPSAGTSAVVTAGSSSGGSGTGSPDASCVSNSTAKEGAMCTQDCMVACGHNMLGTKTCTCAGGLFDNCSCPRPAAYMGAATAPLCPTPDHMTAGLKDMPCTVEWEECIGADATSGPTKQGCVCLKESATSPLKWECGSSNQWYTLAP